MKYFIFLLMFFVNQAFANFSNSQTQFLEAKNLINNPGFEYGLSQWDKFGAAGSSLSTVSGSVSNIANGSVSVAFDASATGQYLGSSLVTIPSGLYGHSCLARFNYKGGDTNLSFLVVDGSGSTLGSSTLLAKTLYSAGEINFNCPTSGSIGVRINASGNAAAAFFDDIFVGENYKTPQSETTVAVRAVNNANGSYTADVTNIDFITETYDSHNAWDGSIFTAPMDGIYNISGRWLSDSSVSDTTGLYVGGVLNINMATKATATHHEFNGTVKLLSGQTMSIRSSGSDSLNTSTTDHWIAITRLK